MEFVFNSLHILTFLGVGYLVYISRQQKIIVAVDRDGHTYLKGVVMKEITELSERVDKLEKILKEFMDKWGPDVQKKRDERDERWDEMIRVLTIQERDNERRSTE